MYINIKLQNESKCDNKCFEITDTLLCGNILTNFFFIYI